MLMLKILGIIVVVFVIFVILGFLNVKCEEKFQRPLITGV